MGGMKIKQFSAVLSALVLAAAGLAALNRTAAAEEMKAPAALQLVILDTDIGDDIDDAFALGLLLRSPEVKLLGIETAFGDTELRARLVDRYLAAVGREDIPVMAGVLTPTLHFSQAEYARHWPPHGPANKHGDGVAFLLEQIRAHPGEITLIAIGPLFNIQAAVERDAATFKKLKRAVIMGGSVNRGYDHGKTGDAPPPASPEWNIVCDPAGARALLGSGVPVFVMPLDSTQVHLAQPQLAALFSHGSPLTDQLTLLYHQWSGAKDWHTPTLYDPVAVTYAIRPELCPMTPMRLEVDDNGNTRQVEGAPNSEVCLQSDEKGFLGFLLGRIMGEAGH